ncbi:unnamed protein product [Calypogeia fissa]
MARSSIPKEAEPNTVGAEQRTWGIFGWSRAMLMIIVAVAMKMRDRHEFEFLAMDVTGFLHVERAWSGEDFTDLRIEDMLLCRKGSFERWRRGGMKRRSLGANWKVDLWWRLEFAAAT